MKLVIFSQASASSAPPLYERVVGDDADGAPVQAREPGDRDLAEARLQLEEAVGVDHRADDLAHVVDLRAAQRQQVEDVRACCAPEPAGTGRTGGASLWWLGQVVEEALDGLERLLVGVDDEIGEARHLGVQPPAAEFLGVDVLLDGERGEAAALETASTAPLRMTQKSESTAYQDDEP